MFAPKESRPKILKKIVSDKPFFSENAGASVRYTLFSLS